jgi:pyrroline-5-carboxylate reductase
MTTQGNSTANGLLTKNQPQPAHLGFIGGGNMAASLISGLVADDYSPAHIIVSDPEAEKRATLSARFGVRSARDNLEAARQAEVLILAVKPQVLQATCHDLRQVVQARRPLIMSVAAGVREQYLQQWLGGGLPLVRTMPNTPAMIQAGATVLHADAGVSVQQCNLAESIMRAVGLTLWVTHEDQMDAVTALSGSGPAYFFLVMEAMEDAGMELGLDAETARLLTMQTALGAARMAMESRDSPAELRARVTSPGGTTERALQVFEEGDLRALFQRALDSACSRSQELSDILGGR